MSFSLKSLIVFITGFCFNRRLFFSFDPQLLYSTENISSKLSFFRKIELLDEDSHHVVG